MVLFLEPSCPTHLLLVCVRYKGYPVESLFLDTLLHSAVFMVMQVLYAAGEGVQFIDPTSCLQISLRKPGMQTIFQQVFSPVRTFPFGDFGGNEFERKKGATVPFIRGL